MFAPALCSLSLQQNTNNSGEKFSHLYAGEQSDALSLRDSDVEWTSLFQQRFDLPAWLHYESANPPPAVLGWDALMVSTTGFMNFETIEREASMLLRPRGFPPTFVAHKPGLDQPL